MEKMTLTERTTKLLAVMREHDRNRHDELVLFCRTGGKHDTLSNETHQVLDQWRLMDKGHLAPEALQIISQATPISIH